MVHSMEYHSALKRNELSSYAKTRRKLKCIFLSERSQSEKATYCVIDVNYMTLRKRQNYGDSKKISGGQGLTGREG